jgi:hypothetical protein
VEHLLRRRPSLRSRTVRRTLKSLGTDWCRGIRSMDTLETVQNLGGEQLAAASRFWPPGHFGRLFPSAHYRFFSCSPPSFWTVSCVPERQLVSSGPFGDCLKVGGKTKLLGRDPPREWPDSRPSPRSKARFYLAPPTLRQSPGAGKGRGRRGEHRIRGSRRDKRMLRTRHQG